MLALCIQYQGEIWNKTCTKLTKHTRATMICVVNEDMVVGTAVDHLPTASLDRRLITEDCSIEITHRHIFSCIILKRKITK